ncbi:MAG: hypothetical protein FJ312_03790 [SAR202 cluster bacterium]|nr:hypothetical protein [SAR202 cluster bacterium]
MLVLYAVLIVLVPAVVILYPFLRRKGKVGESAEDESSAHAELARRWDAALSSLKSAELERSVGNLTEDDYQWLRGQYMAEAVQVMKAMELEEQQEQELLATIDLEVKRIRERALGAANGKAPKTREESAEAAGE